MRATLAYRHALPDRTLAWEGEDEEDEKMHAVWIIAGLLVGTLLTGLVIMLVERIEFTDPNHGYPPRRDRFPRPVGHRRQHGR